MEKKSERKKMEKNRKRKKKDGKKMEKRKKMRERKRFGSELAITRKKGEKMNEKPEVEKLTRVELTGRMIITKRCIQAQPTG